jgi:O-antigen/teichoic acid export membrane protein
MIIDSFFMLSSISARLISNILIFFLIGRFWDVENFGYFMYMFTVTTLLVLIVDYGFALKLVKDISKTPENVQQLTLDSLNAKILLTMLVGILGIVSFLFLDNKGVPFFVLLIAAIFNSYSTFFCLPLRALHYFRSEAKTSIISNTLLVIIVIIFLVLGYKELLISFCFLLVRLINLILVIREYHKLIGKIVWSLLSVNFKRQIKILKSNFPYAIHVTVGTIYLQIDTLIIHIFLGDEGVGYYQAASRFLIGGLILSEVLTNVYIPRLSKVSDKRKELISLGIRMTRHMILVGVIGTILMFGLSNWLVEVVYGTKYSKVEMLLKLFAILLFLRYIGASYGAVLTITNKQKIRVIAVSSALIFNILLNFCLIPKLGLIGGVLSAIISNVLLNILYLYFNWGMINNLLLSTRTVLLVLSGIIFLIIFNFLILMDDELFYIIYLLVSILIILLIGITKIEFGKFKKIYNTIVG